MTTTLRLALRGLWFRRSTAGIVLVLSVVASAASVVAPLYARAAEESILRDTILRTDAFSLAVQVVGPDFGNRTSVGPAGNPAFTIGRIRRTLSHRAFGAPRPARSTRGLFHPVAGPFATGDVAGRVVERPGLCRHLPAVTGRCPTAVGEGMVSRRSLHLLGTEIGRTIQVELPDAANLATTGGAAPVLRLRVVGAYDPVPVEDGYWAGRPYFTSFFPRAFSFGVGLMDVLPPTADPVFLGPGTAASGHITSYTIDVPIRRGQVGLGDTAPMRAQVERLGEDLTAYRVSTTSRLPAALRRAADGQELVRVAAPLAVTQLLLLAWWTLYLVIGSATEEQAPEVGLAKLRGLDPGQTARFGLAESVLQLLAAAPLGTALGYALVRLAAGRVFAPGTEVVLTASVLLTVLGALAGGVVVAALGARRVLRLPVGHLLRRVPPRRAGRRAGLLEGVVIALAAAGIVQLVADRGGRPSPVALVAPGMVAVVGGLLAGRLLVRVARRRAGRALDQGRASALVGWSGVARRPGTARIAAVLAVATCLLLVGVEAWEVAGRNRSERARAETGADVVLHVTVPGPRKLLSAVRQADPGGRYAMAVVQVPATNETGSVLAVDASRADAVLDWGAPALRPARSVRAVLRPALPAPIVLRPGLLQVELDATRLRSPSPLLLAARLDDDGVRRVLPLGRLRTGPHRYRATVPTSCVEGCRLAALSARHATTDIEAASATFTVTRIAAGASGAPRPLDADFADLTAWRPGAPTVGGPTVRLRPGRALRVALDAPGGVEAEIARGDSPEPLPALVGTGVGTEPVPDHAARVAEAPALDGVPSRYLADATVGFVPRAGRFALLADLELGLRLTGDAPAGDRQVWLSRDDHGAEVALVHDLRAAGVEVDRREAAAALERVYAGDGAVLALRLLLVCGAAAVLVSVGALLVAAYVGRRQRAYEVAALRAVGVRRSAVRALLVRESLGTVLVALACGATTALVATWAVLPSLPQFDEPSELVQARFAPELTRGALAVGGLALLLVVVGVVLAGIQLRAGRADRLREGVR